MSVVQRQMHVEQQIPYVGSLKYHNISYGEMLHVTMMVTMVPVIMKVEIMIS